MRETSEEPSGAAGISERGGGIAAARSIELREGKSEQRERVRWAGVAGWERGMRRKMSRTHV